MRSLRVALPIAGLTGALALAYLLPFRAYGLNVEDEGTLLYQIVRFAHGELPYVDFATGYTPGFFALSAWFWWLAGDVVTLRVVVAVLHALTVAGLALIVARLARPSLAVLLPLLYLAFVPVYPGEFCAFNVPYPAWYATLGWVATAGCMLGFVGRRRRPWLVAAGVVAAVTFAVKPNAGAFVIAAASSVLLLLRKDEPGAGVLAGALWISLWIGILGGVWMAFDFTVRRVELAVYLLPLLAGLAALLGRSRVGRSCLAGDVTALLGTFFAVSLPWMSYFLLRLGPAGFLREVLFVGSDAAALYYVPYPGFEPWALVVTALAVGFAVAGWFAVHGWLPPAPAAAVLGLGALLALAAVHVVGLMPEGATWSFIWQLQSAAFALTLGAHAAGVVWLWFRGRRPANLGPAVVLLFALFMHLQLYPRADFMHLLMAAPLSLVFAGYLLERALDAWERGFRARGASSGRLVSVTTIVVIAAAIAVAATPGLTVLSSAERFTLPFDVAPVGVERGRAEDLRDLAASAASLTTLVAPGEESLAFPAASVQLLLTGARNPVAHDYFYAGRPDHREEAEIVDRLALRPPAALVSLNQRFTFFDAAPAYYFLLRRFVEPRYALRARAGRYDVLARRGRKVSPRPPPLPAAAHGGALTAIERRLAAIDRLAGQPLQRSVSPLLRAVASAEPVVRRRALGVLLDGLAATPGHGLEHFATATTLDRRGRILLLRTIRDLRDPRAASYLFVASRDPDPRVVADALGAMYVTRKQMIARWHLWAGAEEPSEWPGRETLLEAVRTTLADPEARGRAVAFAAELARALRDAGSVPALRDRWRAATPAVGQAPDSMVPPTGAATTASVAGALAELAPQGLACELVRVLGREQPPIRELLPVTLLRLAEGDEPMRSEARRCLASALVSSDPGRAEATWIVAALGSEELNDALQVALGAPASAVRRAAAWALGETAPGLASSRALRRAAREDSDPIVRRFARTAMAKRKGARPRALTGATLPARTEAR